jgi:gamma-glutamyltranspeptidase/glutathione hydrolase
MKDNQPVGTYGVMGGFMQPQGHLQVVMNMLDFNMDPQTALDAPRFRWDKGLEVALENTFSNEVIQGLQNKHHHVKIELRGSGFGRGQIIQKTKNGYIAGTETRCDGTIAYY